MLLNFAVSRELRPGGIDTRLNLCYHNFAFHRNVCAIVFFERFDIMKERISITDIARLAGVSSSTVSHVLNQTRYVSPEITERVMKIVADTGYHKNRLACSLRQKRTNTIGIILPSLNAGTYYGKSLEAIEKELSAHGYNLIMKASSNNPQAEKDAIEYLLSWKVDGIIIVLSDNGYYYSQVPCPVVLIDRAPEKQTVSGFYIDNYTITCQVMEQMLQKGYRKIALISPTPQFAPTMHRIQGYQDTLAKHGLPLRQEHICYGVATIDDGRQFAQRIAHNTDADAVLILSSPMTVGAMSYCNENGVRIPQDLGVMTFADYDWIRLSNPQLCGVIQPNRLIGECAARQIYRQLQGNKEIVTQFLPCQYFEGKSL